MVKPVAGASEQKRILLVAAENDFLPGAKVGGVADVIRDLPSALAAQNQCVDVIIPSYGFLARLPGMIILGDIDIVFAGAVSRVQLLEYPSPNDNIRQFVLHHDDFSVCGESVYCDDTGTGPFSTDATKFAFFCAAVAASLEAKIIPTPDYIHCHDWHTGFLFILKEFSNQYLTLKTLKTVFTIHNLAMQGIRPFSGDISSLKRWYPDLVYDEKLICDRQYKNCVNPMRAAVLLADKVHTVSPSYAKEILLPNDPSIPRHGGEHLEIDLAARHNEGNLIGILNGCDYEDVTKPATKKLSKTAFITLCEDNLMLWMAKERFALSAHLVAEKRLTEWKKSTGKKIVLSSIGRITDQKVALLSAPSSSNKPNIVSALDEMLTLLGKDGVFVMLGSGDKHFEEFFVKTSAKHNNFIFLNGFSNNLTDPMYRFGDLFIMPSSFEPCGISQMLAMKAGQPCLVNAVGGLKDTVFGGKNGFVFNGESQAEQVNAMITELKRALDVYKNTPNEWVAIKNSAKKTRVSWSASIKEYCDFLYF